LYVSSAQNYFLNWYFSSAHTQFLQLVFFISSNTLLQHAKFAGGGGKRHAAGELNRVRQNH